MPQTREERKRQKKRNNRKKRIAKNTRPLIGRGSIGQILAQRLFNNATTTEARQPDAVALFNDRPNSKLGKDSTVLDILLKTLKPGDVFTISSMCRGDNAIEISGVPISSVRAKRVVDYMISQGKVKLSQSGKSYIYDSQGFADSIIPS